MSLPYYDVPSIRFKDVYRGPVQLAEGLCLHYLVNGSHRKPAICQVQHSIHMLNNRVNLMSDKHYRESVVPVETVNQLRNGILVVQVKRQ